jgi:hypothetical protein
MSPEKRALSVFWSHPGFFLLHAIADAVWIALALSWFWLPDSKVWGIALAAIEALFLILAAFWLIGKALKFYRRAHASEDVALRQTPWLLLRATPILILRPWSLPLAALLGVYLPYKLIEWHPQVAGLQMQTTSLAIRFLAAFLMVVTSWLALASLLAAAPKKSTP